MRLRVARRGGRQGAVAAELAVLLPLLVFLFVAGVDFARAFYFSVAVTNCARNGAVYGSYDPTRAADTAGIKTAALKDATDLDPDPAVSSVTGVDALGHPYVEVTVTWNFSTVTNYPGVPSSVSISRTVRMRVGPNLPKNS